MKVAFAILCVISLILVANAVIIMMGKGDDMIAGYNLASKQTRSHYHQTRIRIIVGLLLLCIAAVLPTLGYVLALGHKELVMILFPAIAFVLIAATFTAVHLWAKKK